MVQTQNALSPKGQRRDGLFHLKSRENSNSGWQKCAGTHFGTAALSPPLLFFDFVTCAAGSDLQKVKELAEENLELKLRLGLLVRLLISKGIISAQEYAALLATAQPKS